MGEFIGLLGIFTGMAGVVGATLWLIARVTGGAGSDMTLDRRDEPGEPSDRIRRLGVGRGPDKD